MSHELVVRDIVHLCVTWLRRIKWHDSYESWRIHVWHDCLIWRDMTPTSQVIWLNGVTSCAVCDMTHWRDMTHTSHDAFMCKMTCWHDVTWLRRVTWHNSMAWRHALCVTRLSDVTWLIRVMTHRRFGAPSSVSSISKPKTSTLNPQTQSLNPSAYRTCGTRFTHRRFGAPSSVSLSSISNPNT